MSLSLNTINKPYNQVYEDLLSAILQGTQWVTAPKVIPYTNGLTPFLLIANLGDLVDVYINNKFQIKIGMDLNQKQINLKLGLGANYIWIKTSTETFLFKVVTSYYAIYLDAWASNFYYNIKIRTDDASLQLSNPFSLRLVEHQIAFQELLPPIKTVRMLAGRMAVRSLINETTSTRGVIDIATAITNSTPVVVPTRVNLEKFEPSVYGLYTTPQDANGYEFNLWLPNTCVTAYATFLTLVNNLDDSIAKLVSASDKRIVLDYLGTREEHLFDFETNSCSIYDYLNTEDCFSNVNAWISGILDELSISFCAWSYPLSIEVEKPLITGAFDTGRTFSGTGHFDTGDVSDPYGDGFIGTVLTPPLDSGILLDTGEEAKAYEDLECMYEPIATLLGSSLLSTTINVPLSSYSSLLIDTKGLRYILNDRILGLTDSTDIIINNLLSFADTLDTTDSTEIIGYSTKFVDDTLDTTDSTEIIGYSTKFVDDTLDTTDSTYIVIEESFADTLGTTDDISDTLE